MTILMIVVCCGFTLWMLYKAGAHLFEARSDELRAELLDPDLRELAELNARHALALENLREIAFDFELDKISESDYLDLKRRYERQSIGVMRRIDALYGGKGWQERVDALVHERLHPGDTHVIDERDEPTPDQAPDETPLERATHELEERAASEDAAVLARGVAAQPCPECGKQLEIDARFCSRCGAQIDAPLAENPSGEAAKRALS